MDQFGGLVIHPDDHVEFDGIAAERFEREVDAVRVAQQGVKA
ncbi:hypothetical protein AMB3_3659 [plant metagenome]|uniref:Uncharacterized protein n=1 Tax=plant metagenome TaxID=1297885 RepID=A0A484P5S0_9ZZZZ